MSSISETSCSGATDKELLSLYHRKRDQQAFTELVRRHSSMVMGVAQQMMGCSHAAEDVLQATFLVLSKDAHRIRKPEALASWLYGVAFRISARQVKRRARQGASMLRDEVMVSDDPLVKLSEQFEHQTAFEELNRLPEKVRAPMVLRYLQGKSNAEVAESLSLSESAVEGRLKRGRNQLRLRLARQGVTFAAAIAVLEATSDYATAAERSELVAKTVEACFASGVGTDPIGIEVTQLANEEILKMTTTSVLKNVATAALALGVIATGWSIAGSVELRAQSTANEVVLESNSQPEQKKETATKIQGGDRRSYYWSYGGKKDSDERVPSTGRYSVEEVSAAERQIEKAMKTLVEIEFEEATLHDVVALLAEQRNIQIVLDESGLAAEGVTADVPITCSLKGVQLKSALNLMLDQLRLSAMVKDEVLLITSQERAMRYVVPRVYKPKSTWSFDPDNLIDVITTSVSPESWGDVGGAGSIVSINGGLVISASADVHEKVNELLRQIDRIQE